MELFNTDFIPVDIMDDDRCRDAESLYKAFYGNRHRVSRLDVNSGLPEASEGCRSVLEVLVALCVRIEVDIMQDDSLGDRTWIWFWDCIEGLGLDPEGGNARIIDMFIEKRIPMMGNRYRNVAKKNLWDQMNRYLLDKI